MLLLVFSCVEMKELSEPTTDTAGQPHTIDTEDNPIPDEELDTSVDDSGDHMDTSGQNDTSLPETDPCQTIVLLESFGAANRLWSYPLDTQEPTSMAQPSCSGLSALSADNKGQLFGLDHRSNTIQNIDILSGHCTEVPLNLHPDYPDLQIRGLAFLMDSDTKEHLYISAIETERPIPTALLFEETNSNLSFVSELSDLANERALVDLAGTSTGRLFGLHPSNSGSIIKEWDPSTGEQLSNMPTNAPSPEGWSFVWHEGHFTLFISTSGNQTTVYQYDPDNGQLDTLNSLPFQVVGAALPMCAPDESGS